MPKPLPREYPITDYWPFTHMQNWNPSKFAVFIKEFSKMNGKVYDESNQAEFMKNLVTAGFYKPFRELTREELISTWGKYVSLIYYLGIGKAKRVSGRKIFELSSVSKYFLRTGDIVEFLRAQMLRFQYPHGSLKRQDLDSFIRKGKHVIPLVFILQILNRLSDDSLSEAYLSKGELIDIVEKANGNDEVEKVVSKIIGNRKSKITYDLQSFPETVVDSITRLFPFFSGTGLCEFDRKNDTRTVFVKDRKQLDEIKIILNHKFNFYKFNTVSQWIEYYQGEPNLISQKEIQELVNIDEEDKALEELSKVRIGVPIVNKKILTKELLNLLDINSIGRHRKRAERKGRTERIRNYPLYELIKEERGYKCQLCKKDSFIDRNSHNHVEVHHIIEYNDKEDGPDRNNNIIVLCPNCHAKFSFAPTGDIINSYRELRSNGQITLEQFKQLKIEKDIGTKQIGILLEKGLINEEEAMILNSKV